MTPPSPWNLRSTWPTPFQKPQFRPISAHSASAVRADENSSLALIGSRPRSFQRAIDEPCTLLLSPPKNGTKLDFAVFASSIQLLSKKSATKFLRVKTSSGKVVATSFLYLTVHRWITGDVPLLPKICTQNDPSENADFDRFRLIVWQPWELARTVWYTRWP